MSKTLDQASAQFAASALVTTDQLLALKTKEELALGAAVNGVLCPSGTAAAWLQFLLDASHGAHSLITFNGRLKGK